VGIEEVKWDKWGTVKSREFFISVEKEAKIIHWEQVSLLRE
jgi:hypothetical protein